MVVVCRLAYNMVNNVRIVKLAFRKEGNDLFNNTLNTFYLLLYGVRHATTLATLSYWQQGFFYMHNPTDRIMHTTAFVTPVVEHWLDGEIAQWVHHQGSIRQLASRDR